MGKLPFCLQKLFTPSTAQPRSCLPALCFHKSPLWSCAVSQGSMEPTDQCSLGRKILPVNCVSRFHCPFYCGCLCMSLLQSIFHSFLFSTGRLSSFPSGIFACLGQQTGGSAEPTVRWIPLPLLFYSQCSIPFCLQQSYNHFQVPWKKGVFLHLLPPFTSPLPSPIVYWHLSFCSRQTGFSQPPSPTLSYVSTLQGRVQ